MSLLVTNEGIISWQQQEILQFVKTSRPALSPNNAPTYGYRSFLPGGKAAGLWAAYSLASSAESKMCGATPKCHILLRDFQREILNFL